ncbi:hypothetical protein [Candidatus Viridilinea mediisalina]|nr:hypothetical protein [Candidatus Viridilinea mediisalina]
MTLDVVMFIIGTLSLLIAILGGNVWIKGTVNIPQVNTFARFFFGVFGLFCIVMAINMNTKPNEQTMQQQPTVVPTVRATDAPMAAPSAIPEPVEAPMPEPAEAVP